MRGVLYVPGLGTSLYSISTATHSGMEVLFIEDKVTLSRDGTTLMVGRKTGSLYKLGKQ